MLHADYVEIQLLILTGFHIQPVQSFLDMSIV